LRQEILGLSASSRLKESGILDRSAIRDMASGHVEGLQDHSKALWLIWVFNAFLDHRPAAGLHII
jgi:asparagine synthase (glutamine-hydrolysing)